MTFREKIDWLTIAVIALAFGWYAAVYPWGLRGVPALAAQGGLLTRRCRRDDDGTDRRGHRSR